MSKHLHNGFLDFHLFFPNWIFLTPSVLVLAGDSKTVNVTIDAENLKSKTYPVFRDHVTGLTRFSEISLPNLN